MSVGIGCARCISGPFHNPPNCHVILKRAPLELNQIRCIIHSTLKYEPSTNKEKDLLIKLPPSINVSLIPRYSVMPYHEDDLRVRLIVMDQPHIHVFLPHKARVDR